ncbi:MAG TPA: class I SAM-dependent methyltransferase [Anaerolineales bacterium]|nr:class I SAM-dependent methyltransferase [Anaerolineales bacterium]
MNAATALRLIKLNRLFYQTFADQFSATRQRLQPGVKRALAILPRSARILDLGCGNGELWRTLAKEGHAGLYVGLDFSAELLRAAQHTVQPGSPARFLQADLTTPGWDAAFADESFDFVLAFAVLHHLPQAEIRRATLHTVRRLLQPQGRFIHSHWQFLNSPRLTARIQPWETIDIAADQVDASDYLLDWRRGGYGLRYVHHFSDQELRELAYESGFTVLETYHSDGENSQLGLYHIWGPV